MKVQIKSLKVVGAGPLRDVEIDFCDPSGEPRPITLLAGANGSGKTTVLEIIKFLCNGIQKKNYNESNLKIEFAQLNLIADNEPISIIYPPKHNGNRFRKPLVDIVDEVTGKQNSKLITAINTQDDSKLTDSSINQIGSVIYLPYRRFLPKVKGTEIHKEEANYQWVYEYRPSEEFDGSLDSYLIWLDYAEPETYSKTIRFLNGLDFDGKTFSVVRKELKAIVTTRDGQTHDVADLSSGEQNLLIMLLELHRRLLPNSIVLIDEIENSLHPSFQYKIGNALKKMQKETPFQLIVTSHSPTFLDIFGRENTLLLTEF